VIAIVIAGLALAGCGADGEPITPTAKTNVNISTSGVSVGTNVQMGHGPFAVNVGLGL
jgi:hypothetical protein